MAVAKRTIEPAVVHVRTSERKHFHRCILRWKWTIIDGLVTKSPSHALWFGSGIHEALAHYYAPGLKRNKDFVEVWEDWCDNGSGDGMYQKVEDLGDKFIESRELGIAMLLGHEAMWGEYDAKLDFIQSEMPFQVRIPLGDGTWIEYDGTFDGVFIDGNDRKKIKLLENKTAKAISTKHLSLDPQAGAYWAIAYTILKKRGVLKDRQNISGIMYNFLRKSMPDGKLRNKDGYAVNKPTKAQYVAQLMRDAKDEFRLSRLKIDDLAKVAEDRGIEVYGDISKVQPSPLFLREFVKRTPRERTTEIQGIKDDAMWMNAARQGLLPITKNPTNDCSWDCSFFEMCELKQAGVDWEEFRDAVYVVADPYADHRKPA
jgi:hypothetical protein